MESVWFYESRFRTFWIVFSLYFPFSLFAKHLPLALTCPGSFPFCVGFALVAMVLCKSSWEKKTTTTTTQSLAFPCRWIPGPVEHLIIYCSSHQLFLELFWPWAERSQLTEHKPRLGGSPRVCLALAAANGEAAFQGRLQHSGEWRQGETLSITWDRQPQTLTPSNQSREGSAAYYVGKGTSLLHKMAKKEGCICWCCRTRHCLSPPRRIGNVSFPHTLLGWTFWVSMTPLGLQ